jgi:hypothetical protein
LQNKQRIIDLGNACKDIQQLPTSTIVTGELKTLTGKIFGSGGRTLVWKGTFNGTPVAIKAFLSNESTLHELQNIKNVSKQQTWEARSRTNFTGAFGTDTVVEETIP